MYPISLKCAKCGRVVHGEVSSAPRLAIDLIEIARLAGWVSTIDYVKNKVLVFCSIEHTYLKGKRKP